MLSLLPSPLPPPPSKISSPLAPYKGLILRLVNTQVDYGNGRAEQQEPLQSQEESSDVTVQSQKLLSKSE